MSRRLQRLCYWEIRGLLSKFCFRLSVLRWCYICAFSFLLFESPPPVSFSLGNLLVVEDGVQIKVIQRRQWCASRNSLHTKMRGWECGGALSSLVLSLLPMSRSLLINPILHHSQHHPTSISPNRVDRVLVQFATTLTGVICTAEPHIHHAHGV